VTTTGRSVRIEDHRPNTFGIVKRHLPLNGRRSLGILLGGQGGISLVSQERGDVSLIAFLLSKTE